MSKDHLHILGIAGHAMSGVAMAAQKLGYEVTGTDENAYPPGSEVLAAAGIKLWISPDASHLDGVIEVILGGGVAKDHPELVEAQKRQIPVRSYPEVVGYFTKNARHIVVAGTHGKTTTTSLLAWIFESAGRQPDFLVGIKPNNFDASVRLAGGKVAIIEGDEYRSSRLDERSKFYYYHPDVAVITNIEFDHPDLFKDLSAVEERFVGLVEALPKTGRLIYCQQSDVAQKIAQKSAAPAESYGVGGDWQADDIVFNEAGLNFDVIHKGETLGSLSVSLYGRHNVLNALAATAVALGEGLSWSELVRGASGFKGASRRFELASKPGAHITVIDDYAHHPTEVATTINAVKLHFPGRVIAVFRPHTYSRTKGLLKEYQAAFNEADAAYIGEIEGAREAEQTVSGADIATASHVHYQPDRSKLIDEVIAEAQSGDVILCMSVNGYDDLAGELAQKLS